MKKIIEVRNLTKLYKDGNSQVVALDNVSFDLNVGEDLVILGPSGSGKTTLLEIIAGLNTPTKGEVIIDGKDIFKGSDEEISKFRNTTIGFVFQMMHLQDYFNALENVTLPLIAKGIRKTEALNIAKGLLKKVGLENRSYHYPKQLSGGEMQRVAIARALANSPRIIMADEPTGKLDRENANNIIKIFKDIAEDEKVSLIMITHDEKIAQEFTNIIRLDHGKISNKFSNKK